MKKGVKLLLAFLVMTFLLGSSSVMATQNNNFDFRFDIQSWKSMSKYGDGHYRKTNDCHNTWKVNFIASGEGKGNITTFCLVGANNASVSPWVDIAQGSDEVYSMAYSDANKRTVYLGAFNNNYSANGYSVAGYWDEETGVIK